MSATVDAAPTTPAGGQSGTVKRAGVVGRLLKNPMGLIAIIILVTIVASALLAGVLAPYDPSRATNSVLAGPNGVNVLGTDSTGRDILSRLLFGARGTLVSAAIAAGVAIAIGLPAGLIAGYYGSWFDNLSSWSTNILMSLPTMIVLLAVRAAVGPSIPITMAIFGVMVSPGFFRLVRTATQSVRNELYVDAARVAGLSDFRIMARHIFGVVRAPVIIQAAMVCGIAISFQSSLEFLGLGDPTAATWGVMVNDGFRSIYRQPMALVWPTLAITLTIGGFVLLGNALRDALEDQVKVKEKVPAPPKVSGAVVQVPTAVATPHLLEVSNLRIQYPQPGGGRKTVVDGVSWHVDRGEVLGLVGESGSGKSQTAFAVLGLLPDNALITSGQITFDGHQTVDARSQRINQSVLSQLRGKRISYIPQEPMSNLDPSFTIGSQLVRPMTKMLKISESEAEKRALDLLAAVGIKDPRRTFKSYPHQVSGGMAQRVLIAGAISCEPDLIIADEPTTALDVTVQAEVLDVIRDLQRELHQGIILVTHNFGVVADLCDRVAVMQNGRIVEQGDVRTILRTPQDQYTQMLLESMLVGKTPMTKLIKQDSMGGLQ
ncbi:MAG TPA: dipeptide/oligopeptide/nickel ABC transporter permease/ATP-binding protein [Propionibacteriaceae bacterium]|nr:dipeptide/oligopeptide/nickel ABC transporter permease/ATP-binding protein [Propionibacteriaceae bacterium]